MKNVLLIFLWIAVLLPEGNVNAQTADTQIMRAAQAALAAGDYEKAFTEYHAAANDDKNALAQFSLGLFYQNGWGRAVDKVAACQWFEKAAQGGIPVAQHLTGICFEEGVHHPADPTVAANWFLKAAQAGHAHSYCHLGNLYMTGKGFPKDPVKALALCSPAAQQGIIPAQIWMGKFYLQGDASIQNIQEAYRWFETAAQKQSPEAFYYLGIIIDKGLSQEHTPQKARQMFEQAAALKYVPAYFPTGESFYTAEPDPETNRLSAEHLATAYVWFSATVQRSENPQEIMTAKKILQQILAVMPATWLAELDDKVAQHLLESH